MKTTALFVMLALLLALAVMLALGGAAYYFWWAGPPRDTKCFALDDEDFGLGFRIGNPWDPDAFEAAMKTGGLDVVRVEREPREGYRSRNESWYTSDYVLAIHVISDHSLVDTHVKMVTLSAFSPRLSPDAAAYEASSACARRRSLEALAEEKFPDDPAALHQWLQAQLAIMTGEEAPLIKTAAGVTLGSTKAQVKDAYGEPFDWVDIAGHHWLTYTANKVSVTFFLSEGRVSMIDLRRGYRRVGYELRRDAWEVHFMTEEQRRMRDEWIVGGSVDGEGGEENAAGGEEATSEVESVRD